MIDNWRKSSFSAGNAACVETGWTATTVAYRDTKQAGTPDRPTLHFPTEAAQAFLARITR
ncbi:DUF397 domain-containing protein [Actinokineospora pegani]|uniref:DUF397 domain-containing protein n=1 Tax=Actinokineospora pegani TaxID=2654637 RepID=UPI0018D2A4AB|nr:DUF397 domain-containing protein [Actinokineospora pegani]